MTRIMIIRHAEKPEDEGPVHGVTVRGVHDRHDLTVRGWQRAGALVRYFAPADGICHDPLISTPRSIFAAAAIRTSASLRSQHTVGPLAELLEITVNADHSDGDEAGLAPVALQAPGPVLIAWHHKHIPALVDAFTNGAVHRPDLWPDNRFDLVWVLDRIGPDIPWVFTQTAQCLLPRDSSFPI